MRIAWFGLGLTVMLAAACHAGAAERLPAFPGAEGYGRFATGGRGGDAAHVTTLADDGPGSLRDAIRTKQADVPRTVVFDVGGTIRLKKRLRIEKVAGLTLAGQTAPGGGIAVRDHGVEFRACRDLVVRHMRFRLGEETKTSDDVLGFGPEEGTCRDVIPDHVTATWGVRGGKYVGEVTPEKFRQPAEVVPEEERPVTQPAAAAYELVLARAGDAER